MFDHVQFTGTINLGAISGALLTLIGLYIVYMRGKINDAKTRRIIQEESERTRKCVHAMPGHPEGRPPGARTRKSDIIAPAHVSRETRQVDEVNPPLD